MPWLTFASAASGTNWSMNFVSRASPSASAIDSGQIC